jgi:hypothetical protein
VKFQSHVFVISFLSFQLLQLIFSATEFYFGVIALTPFLFFLDKKAKALLFIAEKTPFLLLFAVALQRQGHKSDGSFLIFLSPAAKDSQT